MQNQGHVPDLQTEPSSKFLSLSLCTAKNTEITKSLEGS